MMSKYSSKRWCSTSTRSRSTAGALAALQLCMCCVLLEPVLRSKWCCCLPVGRRLTAMQPALYETCNKGQRKSEIGFYTCSLKTFINGQFWSLMYILSNNSRAKPVWVFVIMQKFIWFLARRGNFHLKVAWLDDNSSVFRGCFVFCCPRGFQEFRTHTFISG